MNPTPASQYHARIFLESHCNFRCVYCNPDAERQDDRIVSDAEIMKFLDACGELGVNKVHYSGGEPTLRGSLPKILDHARSLRFVEQCITTNGVVFDRRFKEYADAGLTRANVSIDSFKPEVFAALTGRDELASVLSAIEKAREHFGTVKVNMVVMDTNIAEIPAFLEYSNARNGEIICRFIELQTNQPIFYKPDRIRGHHVDVDQILAQIRSYGESVPIDVDGTNPNCSYFAVVGRQAKFGIIGNHSRGYPCGGCRKLRLSPYGDLGICISAEGESIRGKTASEMVKTVQRQLVARDELDLVRPNRLHLSGDFGFWRWGDLNPLNTKRPIPLGPIASHEDPSQQAPLEQST